MFVLKTSFNSLIFNDLNSRKC